MLAWLGIIPLLASLVPPDVIALQLVKLGYLKDLLTAGGPGNWDPNLHTFASYPDAIYRAYVRQIGAGAVAAGGFLTLLKTFPTIISSFKGSLASLKNKGEDVKVARTENDLSFMTVIVGSLALVVLMAILPMIPGDTIINKILIGVLVVVFGFFFVTVSSPYCGNYRFKFKPNFRDDDCNFNGYCTRIYCCWLDGKRFLNRWRWLSEV